MEFFCDGCDATFCRYDNLVVHKKMYCRERTEVLPYQNTQDEPAPETTYMAPYANIEEEAYMEGFRQNVYSTCVPFKPQAHSLIVNHPAENHTNYVHVGQGTENYAVGTSNQSLKQLDSWVKIERSVKPIYQDFSFVCDLCNMQFMGIEDLVKHQVLCWKHLKTLAPSPCIQNNLTSRTQNSITISKDINLEEKSSMEVDNKNLYYAHVPPKREANFLMVNHTAQDLTNYVPVGQTPSGVEHRTPPGVQQETLSEGMSLKSFFQIYEDHTEKIEFATVTKQTEKADNTDTFENQADSKVLTKSSNHEESALDLSNTLNIKNESDVIILNHDKPTNALPPNQQRIRRSSLVRLLSNYHDTDTSLPTKEFVSQTAEFLRILKYPCTNDYVPLMKETHINNRTAAIETQPTSNSLDQNVSHETSVLHLSGTQNLRNDPDVININHDKPKNVLSQN